MIPLLRKYRHYLFRHKTAIFWGMVCVLFTNVFGTAKPWVMKYAIDDMEKALNWHQIVYFALFIVALALVQGVFRFFQRQTLIGASRKAEFLLRSDFIAHLQKLPAKFFDQNSSGDLMARASSDVEAVRMAYGPGVMYTVDTVFVTIFSLIMMFRLSWKLTVTALAVFPLVSVTVYILGKITFKKHTEAQESYSRMNTFTQENLSGVRVVKSFTLENQHQQRFSALSDDYLLKNMGLVKAQAFFLPILYFLLGIGIIIVLLLGGEGIIAGELSLGDFAAFMAYLMMLAWPMIAIGWVVNIIQRAEASMKRIDKILQTAPDIVDAVQPVDFSTLKPTIEFRDLDFAFGERGEVLHHIDLALKPGASLGIVGALGSGKSALVRLIPRLYPPPAEKLFIGGIPVENISLQSLRKGIAFVPQDAFLFSDKIRDNITFSADCSEGELLSAAAAAELMGDIEEFPDKLDTVVGERGLTLSGGQKQRVTLARALLKKAPILILDDCLTAVDASTEARILEKLKTVFRGKTVIVVSHRISAVSHLDNIIVLEDGRIVESGKHQELLKLKGVYYRLYRKQLLEMELERV